ncbi:SagB/ThcOx family dehydrogenase [Proteinivorax hydrogeniformans]|uniref:SagB/ThcOx family dehydrogenase n=1 Tax=Proteinivorax hydrogeniformans TaxID=1826727 RepID=A0AAU8HSQ8_9FIRM
MKNREFLKANFKSELASVETDQQKGVERPQKQKEVSVGSKTIKLPSITDIKVGERSIKDCLLDRRSHRKFEEKSLNLQELSFLLWATQGVSGKSENLRTSPSAGARHPFETYLEVHNVEGLSSGLYRYLPLDHELVCLKERQASTELIKYCLNQPFAGECAVTFIWSVIPYRTEWRYSVASHKHIALDAGHLGQNLYLACEAIDSGTCAIGAYDQEAMDKFIEVDGNEEFVIYVSPVGKIR